MAKMNYFEKLEVLSQLAYDAVCLACGEKKQLSERENDAGYNLPEMRTECDRILCELENSLFTDFIPPLERDNIAAYAHCLSRVVERALEHRANYPEKAVMRKNEEGSVCVRLADEIRKNTQLLRSLRKNEKQPDAGRFRELLKEGRDAHSAMMAKMNSGSFPHSYAQMIISTGRLRLELSRCFDELVEIMLNNI